MKSISKMPIATHQIWQIKKLLPKESYDPELSLPSHGGATIASPLGSGAVGKSCCWAHGKNIKQILYTIVQKLPRLFAQYPFLWMFWSFLLSLGKIKALK